MLFRTCVGVFWVWSCSTVQAYSPKCSKDPRVEFAINVVLAYDSNNFTKFFKLVRYAELS